MPDLLFIAKHAICKLTDFLFNQIFDKRRQREDILEGDESNSEKRIGLLHSDAIPKLLENYANEKPDYTEMDVRSLTKGASVAVVIAAFPPNSRIILRPKIRSASRSAPYI